ncbi:YxeA family protein [Bacillus cereus]|uniref:YxeA family protein n=1 Tax=Bacillus cereus TaxID=1396 RepID=UPI002AC2C538|nr:YxeA family protein [Bacillus cereus]MDZ4619214.1 YxeA family protein [Bacillus cereus]
MKKALIAVSGLIVVGGGLLTYAGGDTIDRFNPLVKEKDVYVHTEGKAKPDPEHEGRRFYYVLDGVDELGNTNTIKVGMPGEDEHVNSYLKVHTKGKFVYGFEEVQEEKVPEKVKEKLKKIK